MVPLDLSNTLSSVFFAVLAIAATARARGVWEMRLAFWLAQHDQARSGNGTVGFDVADLAWVAADFAAQRRFLLGAIDEASSEQIWGLLPSPPDPERTRTALARFRAMIAALTQPPAAAPTRWPVDEGPDHGRCDRHPVFLHETGCIVCNLADR